MRIIKVKALLAGADVHFARYVNDEWRQYTYNYSIKHAGRPGFISLASVKRAQRAQLKLMEKQS